MSDPMPAYRQVRDEIGEFVKSRLPGLLGITAGGADVATEEPNPLLIPVVPTEAIKPEEAQEASLDTPAIASDESEENAVLPPELATTAAAAPPAMGVFEKYLTVWVLLCMILGGIIGYFAPSVADGLATAQVADISIPVAILLWCMIFPMLVQIDFAAVLRVREKPGALMLTSAINYLVKPFTMYALAMLFFRVVYVNILDKELQDQYIAGCVILAGAPCTAMVFVWSLLMGGDGAYTLMQVAVNDLLMLALYTPTVMLLLGVSSIPLPYATIVIAVVLFIVAPLIISAGIRHFITKYGGLGALDRVIARFKPVTIIALLATLVLIFIFQGQKIGNKPLDIVLVAVPIIMQTVLNFCICYSLGYATCIEHVRLGPASLIATSNFFELAVAVAISVYGLQSGAALATVVGVLVEVPVMLALVKVCNWLRPTLDKRIDTCDCSWQKRCCPGQQRTLPITSAN
jgi:ACR3 family arsenite transporter